MGIYSNNLDEFFRVRVALLNRIAEYNDKDARTDRQCAIQTLKTINKLNTQYAKEYEATIQQVENDLEKENIYILKDTQLDEMQKLSSAIIIIINSMASLRRCGSRP